MRSRSPPNLVDAVVVVLGMRSVEFTPGQTILRRYWTGDRITVLNVLRVIADDDFGLRCWLPDGTPYWRILTEDGRTQHEAPFEVAAESCTLTEVCWRGTDAMIWVPPDSPYSVWWFWDPVSAEFRGWYGNLEATAVRWDDGVVAGFDTADHALDLWVDPDNSWAWKDLDEFAERTGHPLYWTHLEAIAIRETGDRLAELAETAGFPFDGTWTGCGAKAEWPAIRRTGGWDRPRAQVA